MKGILIVLLIFGSAEVFAAELICTGSTPPAPVVAPKTNEMVITATEKKGTLIDKSKAIPDSMMKKYGGGTPPPASK